MSILYKDFMSNLFCLKKHGGGWDCINQLIKFNISKSFVIVFHFSIFFNSLHRLIIFDEIACIYRSISMDSKYIFLYKCYY
jgi:hypothetical protein